MKNLLASVSKQCVTLLELLHVLLSWNIINQMPHASCDYLLFDCRITPRDRPLLQACNEAGTSHLC